MFESLTAELDSCQLADRHRLRRKLGELEKRSRTAAQESDSQRRSVAELSKAIARSQRACQHRQEAIPKHIDFPSNLPVSAKADEIAELISSNQVLVVAGDTGSGKTTQLPKICLQAGLGRLGLIGHTQPRRLAAVSVANRIAEELHTETGKGVGYQVRFNEKTSQATFLKLMTDGILLAEIQHDRYLNRYQVLIIDEAHERSLNIDFLLGFLSQLLEKRQDLKLIITSATIDVEKFSTHFNDARIVSVSGRTYPVATRYAPLGRVDDESFDDDTQLNAIIEAVEDISQADRIGGKLSGDILVFLSGEREIRETAIRLRKQRLSDTEILPLYSRLRHSEQLRIFKAHQGRRIVLATNVAETSITVPGINYVIDTGFARISRYSLQSKVQRLPIEAISQASADQRKGRCGRLADGICIRLYSEQDFDSRPLFTDPEIKRTNLASVILRMKFLRLGDIEAFPFLEPPEQKAINEGLKLLTELNALTSKRELTDSGRKMAIFPVDPKFARMLVEANTQRCLPELLIIVSALSIQDPREISADNRQQVLQKLAEFNHPESDFLGFVNLWDSFEEKRQNFSQNQLKKYCRTHFLSFMRMREWREVHRQLLLSCQQLGFSTNSEKASYQAIHQCIIAGSLNQIARRSEGRNYLGNRNKKFSVFSSSVIGTKPAKWIVTGELIETSQTFASVAAKIQPEWVEQMALHLVKREFFEPHWSKKQQQVMAYQKVSLYGLAIIEKSLVTYSHIDPLAAREIFIRQALVEAQLVTNSDFYRHNLDFLESLNRQEEKIRRPDFFVSDRDIAQFYQQHLPVEICSTADLESWLRKLSKGEAKALEMTQANLIGSDLKLAKFEDFPDATAVQRNHLSIDYVFEPGSQRDGATLEVPEAVIDQLSQADLDWAVPGIVRDKSIALIKSLPKTLRKNFIPVSGFVDEILPQMSDADGELLDALLAQIRNTKGLRLTRSDFEGVELPQHLVVKISVLNESGEEVAFSENLQQLKQQLNASGEAAQETVNTGGYQHALEVQGLQDWSFDELPQQVEIGAELTLIRYPALVDNIDSVAIELFADKELAAQTMRNGLVRLYMLRSAQQKNALKKKFTRFVNNNALGLFGKMPGLVEDVIAASYAAAFAIDEQLPGNRAAFEKSLQQGKPRILGIADKIEAILLLILEQQVEISRKLRALASSNLSYLEADIRQQLENLVYEGFITDTGILWLSEYRRYLAAINFRLSKAPHMGDKDRPNTEQLGTFWRKYRELASQPHDNNMAELHILRWMIEEYRVSLFAQALGTRVAVSAKKLEKQLDKIVNSTVR